MKKSFFLIIGILLICNISNAQYRVNKKQFDHKTYTYQYGDPSNPTMVGVASYFVPGLGQMLMGEGARGVAFLASYTGCMTLSLVGIIETFEDIDNGGDGARGQKLMWIGLGSSMGIAFWSVFDAVRVAKVNNLAFRAQNRSSIVFKIEPYLFSASAFNSKTNVSTGLSLKIKF